MPTLLAKAYNKMGFFVKGISAKRPNVTAINSLLSKFNFISPTN